MRLCNWRHTSFEGEKEELVKGEPSADVIFKL